jgi:hypothetical protein
VAVGQRHAKAGARRRQCSRGTGWTRTNHQEVVVMHGPALQLHPVQV